MEMWVVGKRNKGIKKVEPKIQPFSPFLKGISVLVWLNKHSESNLPGAEAIALLG